MTTVISIAICIHHAAVNTILINNVAASFQTITCYLYGTVNWQHDWGPGPFPRDLAWGSGGDPNSPHVSMF